MKKSIFTLMLALIVSASMAQIGKVHFKSEEKWQTYFPILFRGNHLKVTPVDTSYYGNQSEVYQKISYHIKDSLLNKALEIINVWDKNLDHWAFRSCILYDWPVLHSGSSTFKYFTPLPLSDTIHYFNPSIIR